MPKSEFLILIESLRAVGAYAEPVTHALMSKQMTPEKQREYAGMLKELAEMLEANASKESGETGA